MNYFVEIAPTSPSKLTANGGESDLINRLTAPTSSSAAKQNLQNRKTDGRKPERNQVLDHNFNSYNWWKQ